MGIKYHQYGCGNDYGDDHYLTDNWNPDYDYGSQYVEVYFNILTFWRTAGIILKTALKNVLTYIPIHSKLVESFLKMMSGK